MDTVPWHVFPTSLELGGAPCASTRREILAAPGHLDVLTSFICLVMLPSSKKSEAQQDAECEFVSLDRSRCLSSVSIFSGRLKNPQQGSPTF